MKLLALSDLHVRHRRNREAIELLEARPDDVLILAGDLAEKVEDVRWVFETLAPRFSKLVWVPGNHELWSRKGAANRGVARYEELVELGRSFDVLTPEDPPLLFEGEGGPALVVPLFLLYDYSFCPDGMTPKQAIAWAAEERVICTDEWYLDASPFPSRQAWCADRVALSEARLDALPADVPKVLVNHFPFRLDLCRLFRIPRFVPWCGTRATEQWHKRWNTKVVVHGHLHMRATDWRDGIRFEEVSLGYPRHWRTHRTADYYLREILPDPGILARMWAGPIWHR
jgi:predicted phosphodiesterase